MESLTTRVKMVDALPLLKQAMERINLFKLLDKYVPNTHGADIPPAQVLCMLVMNILHAPHPLYQIPEWLTQYLDGVGESPEDAAKYNDDRSARALDALFDCDRGSLLAELSAIVIKAHQLQTDLVHNDTTTITLMGAYDTPDSEAVTPCHGYNKDHRPDCKQLVFGLNVLNDGHVPIFFNVHNGNTPDVKTHQPNWKGLCQLLGKTDFIYVADSKLCALENLMTIDAQGGRFVTVMPRTFKAVGEFLEGVRTGFEIPWQETVIRPDSRKKNATQTYRVFEMPELWNNFRVVWVHSSTKAALENKMRQELLTEAETKLTELNARLNKGALKTRPPIEEALSRALGKAEGLLDTQIKVHYHVETVKIGPGRPGPGSQYQERARITFSVEWQRNEAAIAKAARSDGLFPLVHNTALTGAEVLLTYKDQPHLERRFATGKSVLEVAPMFFKSTRRIEAMTFLFFIALMLIGLIERAIRKAMQQQEIEALPIRPSRLKTKAPTWRVIRDFFLGVNLTIVCQEGRPIHTFLKGITGLHEHTLRLLGISPDTYLTLGDRWWQFEAHG